VRRISTNGFTIVELLVVMVVSGVLLGVLIGPLTNLYYANLHSLNTVLVTGNSEAALRRVASDVTLADSFYGTNPVNDPAGPGPTWGNGTQWTGANSYTGADSDHRILIIGSYATTGLEATDTSINSLGQGSAPTRQIVLNKSDCTTPIENDTIYFVKNGTLYRRTIPDNTTLKCNSTQAIAQKQSCPVGYSGVKCAASDAVIAVNVDKFNISYYASPANYPASPLAITSGGDPSSATTVYITLQSHTGSGSQLITSSSSLLVTRTNGAGV
jgi:prepilin-type N-terminal cleavage/methylation domain-containing protein